MVELPRNRIEELVENYDQVQLVHIDDVMFLRPICQSAFNVYADTSVIEDSIEEIHVDESEPIIGVFDGMPIQNHPLLKNRIILDDPDDYESGYESKNRSHGTAMASLILNGDLNKKESLNHRIYLRPILKPRGWMDTYVEEIPSDCLIVDKIHAAIVRLFEKQNGIEPIAPSIRIINLSLGDPVRQLATLMSPLARLIDYMAYKYSVLFIVSAGNHPETIDMLECTFDELKGKEIHERSKEYFKCISENQRNIKVLSPAENINGLTIGALYDDYCDIDENNRAIFAVQKVYLVLYLHMVKDTDQSLHQIYFIEVVESLYREHGMVSVNGCNLTENLVVELQHQLQMLQRMDKLFPLEQVMRQR